MSRFTLQSLASLALVGALAVPVAAQDPAPNVSARAEDVPQLFTIEELDNLLAPVALYPDPILAQLLVAATFPEQVALAARYVRTYGQERIDQQAWDVSVKSIAHYPPVLNMLDERPDWTTALGQAYALQEGDVMAAVQGLRRMAHEQGNLVSTDEQKVEVDRDYIRIVPAQPRVIYVPTYDPAVVYYRPVHYHRHVHSPHWSFGIAFPIGVWLTYDFDWGHRVVYYHGWDGYGRGHTWYHVSRPFIYINTVYVNPWRTVVVINRRVVHRYVDYRRFDGYNWVHRRVTWDRRGLPGRYDVDRQVVNTPRTAVPRTAQPRDREDRVRPIPTRSATAPRQVTRQTTTQVTRSASPDRAPRDNGTWNARPTTTAAPRRAPERTNVPRVASAPRVTSAPRTNTPQRASVPRTSVPRTSVPRTSAPRTSAPSRASVPARASSPPRASAPSRASAPARASAPSRGSAPSRASAPSRGSSSSRSEGRSVKRGGD